MKHTPNFIKGFFTSNAHKEHKVIVDKYSGNDYRVVQIFDDELRNILGRSLKTGHSFRRARKSELPQFEVKR